MFRKIASLRTIAGLKADCQDTTPDLIRDIPADLIECSGLEVVILVVVVVVIIFSPFQKYGVPK